jgi:hypothetical protein
VETQPPVEAVDAETVEMLAEAIDKSGSDALLSAQRTARSCGCRKLWESSLIMGMEVIRGDSKNAGSNKPAAPTGIFLGLRRAVHLGRTIRFEPGACFFPKGFNVFHSYVWS